MNNLKLVILCLLLVMASGCKKYPNNANGQKIPNGDFEQWNSWPVLINWHTNSCPLCMGPYKQYVVVKDSLAYHGKYAAKFIFNGIYKSWAQNKFAISKHPGFLTGYINSKVTAGDTAKISIDIYYKKQIVDSGKLYVTSSITNYKQFEIPITNNSLKADSAEINITGGGKLNTELTIDYLTLIKK